MEYFLKNDQISHICIDLILFLVNTFVLILTSFSKKIKSENWKNWKNWKLFQSMEAVNIETWQIFEWNKLSLNWSNLKGHFFCLIQIQIWFHLSCNLKFYQMICSQFLHFCVSAFLSVSTVTQGHLCVLYRASQLTLEGIQSIWLILVL